MTGQSMNANDRRSSRGSWLLMNIEGLKVIGVHSLLWHKVENVYRAPLIDQLARSLNVIGQLTEQDLQQLGSESSVIDILGIKDEERIREDHESLWTLPDRMDDELFRGLPACRGGRTLGILASMALRQMQTEKLLLWKEEDQLSHFARGEGNALWPTS